MPVLDKRYYLQQMCIRDSAMDFKSEGYILGLGAKMFSITGPVLVYGLSSGVIYGVILYLFKLY